MNVGRWNVGRWLVTASILGLVAVPVSAAASQQLLRTPESAPLAFGQLAPGHSRSSAITVSNPTDGPAEIALAVTVSEEDENGCARQEARVATERCDADGGELGDWLDVTVSRDGTELWTGPVRDLAEPQQMPGSLAAGGTWDLDLTMAMPTEAGNDTMTDRIAFDLGVHAADATGVTAERLGIEASTDNPVGTDTTGGGLDLGNVAAAPIAAVDAGLGALDRLTGAGAPKLALLTLGGLTLAVALGVARSSARRRT